MLAAETRDRFRRHAAEIVGLVTMGTVMGAIGVFPDDQSLWVVPTTMLAGTALVTVLYTRWGARADGRTERARIVVQTGALTVMTYSTGWGYALPLVQLFAVADNVKHGGARTIRTVLVAAAGWTVAAQTLLSLGLTPNVHSPLIDTWAIAAFMLLAVAGVSLRIRQMARQREEADARRSASEARFRALVEESSDVILVITDGAVSYASPSIVHVLGMTAEDAIGLVYVDRVHPDDRQAVVDQVLELLADPSRTAAIACRLRTESGRYVPVETRVTNRTDLAEVGGFVLNMRDISERRQLERQLEHRAFHDPLTELPNRTLFRDRVEHAIARAERNGDECAVLFIDLDGFKDINDTLGHAAGDTVLAAVAERILLAVRTSDTVARLGGDEFAILLEDLTAEDVPGRVAQRVLDHLRIPVAVIGTTLDLGASIGIAVWSRGWTQEDLLRNADMAMYAAKSAGKGTFKLFEPHMHARVVERLELERDLRHAIEADLLELHYQPIVRLADDAIVGVEALARWTHPVRGAVSPGQFIPIAEDTGMIVALGRWALRTALRQVAGWQRVRPGPPLGVSVNVATQQLAANGFVQDVRDALQDTGIAPSSVTLEITESALLSNSARTLTVLTELKQLGVRLAIDDFGTGYSSLSYLQRFPLDTLKIDREFIMGMAAGTQSPALVRAIIEMSRSLDLQTVAEGIEHAEELARVRTLSCQLGQGYLFGHPAAADVLEPRLLRADPHTAVG